jgi:TRAP-type C4-dicarboxylate transport system substrate-binding protein
MSLETRASAEKPIELVIHNIHEHGNQILDLWMQEVATRSGGRVKFRKTTGEDPAVIKAADIVRDVPVAEDRYPLLNLIQIPFIFPGSRTGSRVIAQLYQEFPALRQELSDVKVVGLGIGALLAIYSSSAWGPIRTLQDFQGARTRSLPLIDAVLSAFGAQPRQVGWFDMTRLLKSGELDALVLGVIPAHNWKLADGLAPFCTLTGKTAITMHPMRIYMPWESWNRLPADIQTIIEGIGPAGSDCWYAVNNGRDSDAHLDEALDYIRQKGHLYTLADSELEAWRQLALPISDHIIAAVEAKGLPARQFFNRLKELVARYA